MCTRGPEALSRPPTRARWSDGRSRWPLVALLVTGLAAPLGASGEEWVVRRAAAEAAGAPRCLLESRRIAVSDGYRETWAQILVDDRTVRVSSDSVLDPGDGDIGLEVDGSDFVPLDDVVDRRTAVFSARYTMLVEAFERGRQVRAQLRFWPTWPKTGTHSATFSLMGFTRARARMVDCKSP